MKKGYWLILIFLFWCLASAIWYMFGVKGISNDPEHFTPQPPLQAIIEILFMITGAFIMGFGLAWLMREVPFNRLTHILRTTETVVVTQKIEITTVRTEAEVWQKKWEQAEEKFGQAVQENESRLRQTEDAVKKAEAQQKELRDLEMKAAKLDGEVSSTHFRIRLLENDVSEKDLTIKKMAAELEELHQKPHVEHRDWSDHPFVRPVELDPNERDDLTMIKGIGPAFQRKLNSLDIFTFRQISELSGEGVARLAEVIEVFPDRIHRDNWIGQATKLYAKKLEG